MPLTARPPPGCAFLDECGLGYRMPEPGDQENHT